MCHPTRVTRVVVEEQLVVLAGLHQWPRPRSAQADPAPPMDQRALAPDDWRTTRDPGLACFANNSLLCLRPPSPLGRVPVVQQLS